MSDGTPARQLALDANLRIRRAAHKLAQQALNKLEEDANASGLTDKAIDDIKCEKLVVRESLQRLDSTTDQHAYLNVNDLRFLLDVVQKGPVTIFTELIEGSRPEPLQDTQHVAIAASTHSDSMVSAYSGKEYGKPLQLVLRQSADFKKRKKVHIDLSFYSAFSLE